MHWPTSCQPAFTWPMSMLAGNHHQELKLVFYTTIVSL